MVGPAAKRAAVALLQAVMSLSERRACSIVGADRKMIRCRSSRPADAALCAAGCAISPTSGGVSATAGCSSCCGGRGCHRGSTGSTGFIARKGSPSASDALAAKLWGPVLRSW